MQQAIFNLIDSHFAHSDYCVPGVASQFMAWDRDLTESNRPTFVTHEAMYKTNLSCIPRGLRFGLLVESQSVIPRVYRKVESVIAEYELVFTHSSRLLNKYPNTRWIPGGGIWVGGTHGGGQIGIPQKFRQISILSSAKLSTPLHRKRYATAWRLERRPDLGVSVFRQPLGSSSFVPIIQTLEDFRYSICVENFQDDGYFTEKLLNCMATGTVPVYFGARRIDDYFDPGGLLHFRSYRDLVDRIIPSLGAEDYNERLSSVNSNLQRALQYRSIEDFIFSKYFSN